jgi:tetratricopeptide (TPR) repeat protein
MSLVLEAGDLARTPLAALLLDALNQRIDGVLSVEHGGGTSRLWFRAGQPVGAQVVTGFRPLGHLLLQAGKIDVDALSRSLAEMAASGRPQGEILVEMGAVSRADVDEALAEQQAGYFRLIAALESGAYAFDAAQPVPEWTRGSRLSPLRTIVDALERPQGGALVISALQPVAQGGARLASGYAEGEAAFAWTPPERALVERLSAPASLEGFFAPAEGVSQERARAVLAALLLLGLAVPVSEMPEPSGDTSAGLTLQGVASAAAQRAQVDRGAVAPAVPLRRSDPGEARARRQRLLARAMQNLGIGPFGGRAPAPAGPAAPQAAGATPAPAPAPAPAGRPTPGSADAALRIALLEAAPRARERNLFARLGLADGAGKDEVKRAFLQVARQFHPDRFASPALADMHDAVRDFFTAINEAYEVLSDDRKRAEWLAAAKGGAADPLRAESARVDFQKGEACLRTRDLARARGFLESAVRADPRPEHVAALAWTWVVDPGTRDLARARALLADAVKDAACDRAQFVMGVVAREEGNEPEAERWFRAALAANPRHPEAIRELKLLEGRRAHRRQ